MDICKDKLRSFFKEWRPAILLHTGEVFAEGKTCKANKIILANNLFNKRKTHCYIELSKNIERMIEQVIKEEGFINKVNKFYTNEEVLIKIKNS